MSDKQLPKILYVSDVPVELSYAGATLMYRLLEHYPKDRLVIVQGMELNSKTRIPGIRYIIWKSAFVERLKITRIRQWLNGLMVLSELFRFRSLQKIVDSFQPDIILTVSFRLMWLQAFRLSVRTKLPLHLILHDDWLTSERYGRMQSYLAGQFEKMYRHAKGRFCISANMEKYYHGLYGLRGQVMYPFRGKNDKLYPVRKKSVRNGRLKFCYAGSLFTADFAPMLNRISGIIAEEAELHIFSSQDKAALQNLDHLKGPHVIFHGLVHPEELMRKMSEEMDVAILINSFEWEEAFRYNFSSKLVDYTSASLAVLFWGPSTSGAIDWALTSKYEGVVTSNDTDELSVVVKQLFDVEKRFQWATRMSQLGREQFGYERNCKVFEDQIKYGLR